MKQYIKDNIIQFSNEIVIIKDDFQIINPSHEILLENGWVEYVEANNIDDIDVAKQNMIQNIKMYDKSDEIESFYIDDEKFWFNKEERSYLTRRFEAEIKNDQSTTTIWYNNIEFMFDLIWISEIFDKVELYASKCFDVTQRHINEVNSLVEYDEIDNYDFMAGYPQQLKFYTK